MASTKPATGVASRRVLDLPAEERPRELMDRVGAEHLSTAALLAILLQSGTRGHSVIDIADGLLRKYGSLSHLARISAAELANNHGIKRVKAQKLKVALELARRLALEGLPAVRIHTPADVVRLLTDEARPLEQERLWVLPLDNKGALKCPPLAVTQGLADASLTHPREVFKEAIRCAAISVVIAHNHPSGDPTPSAEDLRVTRELVAAGKVVHIPVQDHVIIGRGQPGYVSLRESGLADFS